MRVWYVSEWGELLTLWKEERLGKSGFRLQGQRKGTLMCKTWKVRRRVKRLLISLKSQSSPIFSICGSYPSCKVINHGYVDVNKHNYKSKQNNTSKETYSIWLWYAWWIRWDLAQGQNGTRIGACAKCPAMALITFDLENVWCPASCPTKNIPHIIDPVTICHAIKLHSNRETIFIVREFDKMICIQNDTNLIQFLRNKGKTNAQKPNIA